MWNIFGFYPDFGDSPPCWESPPSLLQYDKAKSCNNNSPAAWCEILHILITQFNYSGLGCPGNNKHFPRHIFCVHSYGPYTLSSSQHYNITSAHLQTTKYVVSVSISVIVSLHYELLEEFTGGSAELWHRGAGD